MSVMKTVKTHWLLIIKNMELQTEQTRQFSKKEGISENEFAFHIFASFFFTSNKNLS